MKESEKIIKFPVDRFVELRQILNAEGADIEGSDTDLNVVPITHALLDRKMTAYRQALYDDHNDVPISPGAIESFLRQVEATGKGENS